ncbi:unnamed protein product [Ambrosiozyma monospora]|uniref:Unnamed protein product n=1 Tax=Ambrosiozyma monospora TaxID=43982 RepID=A0A9W6YV60_AMBMO|nr:unnamed protein product [Ambrosiozyma monospora]
MSWSPLPSFLCGKAVKPFTPLLDHPDLISNKKASENLKNIYPGDIVYIFETNTSSKKWVRGYVVSQLNPSDFSLAAVSTDVIQENKIAVVIFPLAIIEIIKEIEVTSTDDNVQAFVIADGSVGFSFNGTETDVPDSHSLSSGSTGSSGAALKKTQRPALPSSDFALSITSLVDEIEAVLKGSNVQIFAIYTRGDILHFNKMIELFHELQDIKLNFQYGLLTKQEVKLAKKKAAFLMTMISKTIASSTGKQSLKDVAGYESILARDEVSGQLFVPERDNFEKSIRDIPRLAQNQLFGALSSNFPVVNSDIKTYPEKSTQFVQSFPSHILVDFKAFSGECHNVPDGYLGFTAYMHLRNTKKRLTETYAIEVGANNEIAVDGLSSALFKNIPANEVEHSRIYLVALITETVQMRVADQRNGVPTLQTIRKGMCAGAVDISRIFSRRNDHLSPDESHDFSMKLYASYMTEESQVAPFKLYSGIGPLLSMPMTMENNGWAKK